MSKSKTGFKYMTRDKLCLHARASVRVLQGIIEKIEKRSGTDKDQWSASERLAVLDAAANVNNLIDAIVKK